jgi:hypothetical protein
LDADAVPMTVAARFDANAHFVRLGLGIGRLPDGENLRIQIYRIACAPLLLRSCSVADAPRTQLGDDLTRCCAKRQLRPKPPQRARLHGILGGALMENAERGNVEKSLIDLEA